MNTSDFTYKLVIFDWDGTLMDSQQRIVNCLRASADDMGLPSLSTQMLKNVIGLGLNEAIGTLYSDLSSENIHHFADRYRYHFLTANDTPMDLFKNVRQLLQGLTEKGYLLAIATGKARRGLKRVLQETQLEDMFHGSRCADETRSKPHPQMLEELLDEFGLAPHEAIMIGDTGYDMMMANSIKMDCLAVSYGVHDKSELLRHDPVACVDSIQELFSWFQKCETH